LRPSRLLESAKQSWVVRVNQDVFTMIKGSASWNRPLSGEERSGPLTLGKAKAPAVAESELGSASLRQVGAASLPKVVKPASVGKGSIRSVRRAARGGSRQRASKEPPDPWEVRLGVLALRAGQLLAGSHTAGGAKVRSRTSSSERRAADPGGREPTSPGHSQAQPKELGPDLGWPAVLRDNKRWTGLPFGKRFCCTVFGNRN